MSRMLTVFGQLFSWILVTLATWAACWWLVSPVSCQQDLRCHQQMQISPGHYHVVSMAALLAMAGHEVVGLVAAYVGTQKAQALIPHIKSRCLPSCLLALMFGSLAVVEWLFSHGSGWIPVAHVMHNVDGLIPEGRPTYTLQYLEWNVNVPIIFVLSGYCSLGRPLQEVSRPLMVTNVYIILSWAATATGSCVLKWSLITVAFAMYAWASRAMFQWCNEFHRTAPRDLPSREVRPWINHGLILQFLGYGATFLLSALGLITVETERRSFFLMTFGQKISICAIFVFIRADEYHKTLTDVLRKVSVSNVGMISILRGSFDILLPCVVDSHGRCMFPWQMAGDMGKLEKMLGCSIAGTNIKDLLASESDRADFASYLRNVLRQADHLTGPEPAALWTSEGSMPPIAQVLHSKMQGKGKKLQASLHLSVVPKSSAVSHCRERHLMVAIQCTEDMNAGSEMDAKGATFEEFKTNQRQISDSQSTDISDAQTSQCDTDSTKTGIVASLADLRKLGASLVLASSGASEEASNWGPSLVTDDAMSHLGAMVELEKQQIAMDARLAGIWEGSTSQELGAYKQRIEFKNDCLNAEVMVLGHTLPARISMNCSVEPHRLDIEVIPEGSVVVPPAIPYIFKIVGDSLHLCGPADGAMKRPKSFEGPGLCIMERVSLPEPEPELSRTASPKALVAPVVKGKQAPKQSAKWWFQEPVVAASLTLAMASTLVALRKSL